MKWFIAFVFVIILIGWMGQGLIITYFIKNPDVVGGWIGKLIDGYGS